MFDINKLARKNILSLKPYSCARDEFTGDCGVFLDANENPFGTLNRYPDPYQKILKNKISEIKHIDSKHVFIGNGSDEIIDLIYRVFCNPQTDYALIFPPTYGMYEVLADINNVRLIKLPLDKSFQVNFHNLNMLLRNKPVKLLFLCSPNNPTGNSIDKIDAIIKNFKGIVVIDEAYIDFSKRKSYVDKLDKYPNLIVMQTLSKAWGLAAARIGIAYAGIEIIKLLNKVKPPYNVSLLNQKAAFKALNDISGFEKRKAEILSQKIFLESQLHKIPVVKKVYNSDANFFLVEMTNADMVYNKLVAENIITRNRNSVVNNCIRITVGTKTENKKLLKVLKTI